MERLKFFLDELQNLYKDFIGIYTDTKDNRKLLVSSINSYIQKINAVAYFSNKLEPELIEVESLGNGQIKINLLPIFVNFPKEEQIKIAMRLHGINESDRENFDFIFNNKGYINCVRYNKQCVEYMEITIRI